MNKEEIKKEIVLIEGKLIELKKALAELEGKKPVIKVVDTTKGPSLPLYHELEGTIVSINTTSDPIRGEVKVFTGLETAVVDFTMYKQLYQAMSHKYEVGKKVICSFPKEDTVNRTVSISPVMKTLKLVY